MAATVAVIWCLMLVGTVDAFLTCHFCYHHVYTSSDSSLDAFLDTISEYDNNCLKHGEDYREVYENTCFGECIKETGTATLRYGTSRVTFEVAQRGCSTTSNNAGTCQQLTVSNLVSEYGFSVESEDAMGCYCDTDYCNHGNKPQMLKAVLFVALMLSVGSLFV